MIDTQAMWEAIFQVALVGGALAILIGGVFALWVVKSHPHKVQATEDAPEWETFKEMIR